MYIKNKLKFFQALSVFVGSVVGVGIFGLPYITSKAGFPVMLFYFLILSVVSVSIHLLFAEIILGTEKDYRFPGYVGKYLGPKWKTISFISMWLGLTGALLAYLLVGGEFLRLLFASFVKVSLIPFENSIIPVTLFFIAGAIVIFKGIKTFSRLELPIFIGFFAILIIFFKNAFPYINFGYFKTVDLNFFFFPYGAVLFSLWGAAIIPEIKDLTGNNQNLLRKVIIYGFLIAAVTYIFFIFTVFGATGPNTSEEAIAGLVGILGPSVIVLGLIFGIINCFDSFVGLGLSLKNIFMHDLGFSKNFSWLIACFFPFLLYLAGVKEFIKIISLTGVFAIGTTGIITVFLYKKFLENKGTRMNPVLYGLSLFLIIGIVIEIIYFFFK
ncbi:MAG: aromatic amino acid transport family protein [Candidatus Parcubacteria bacterium]|nr:aromatic amino acid transport family protein [Candidatus Parcubacteria bacterium]